MNKEKLTADQQAAAIKLCDELGAIYTQVERVKRLSIDIQEGYFDKTFHMKLLKDEASPQTERLSKLVQLTWDYDTYRVYSEILADLACDLEIMVNDLC